MQLTPKISLPAFSLLFFSEYPVFLCIPSKDHMDFFSKTITESQSDFYLKHMVPNVQQ